MNERSDLAQVLFDIDQTIAWYLKSNAIVEQECGYSNGHLKHHSKLNEYETRRRKVRSDYESQCYELDRQLKDVTGKLPALDNFFERYLQEPPKFIRRYLILSEIAVHYPNFEHHAPAALRMPLTRPLCVTQENGRLLLQIMLRLLFTLPPGLCHFHIYDPCHFGNSVECFDVLREVEQVFPDKIFLCTDKEFNVLLENLSAHFALLRQKLFPEQNCRSWREYNQAMRRNAAPRKQLPYEVLICFDLPEQCKQEHLTTLKRLSDEGARFGFLLLFSYRAEALIERKNSLDGSIEAYQNERTFAALRAIYKNAAPLEKSFTHLNDLDDLRCLLIREELLPPIKKHVMENLLVKWREMFLKKNERPITFDEMISFGNFFDMSALDGLQIPLGMNLQNNELLKLPVGDLPPHTLIAGMTGSGKSNLLHVLICNACARYSPEELNLYLLDFKDGVEFATYAKQSLPHAKLIATQADANYAQTVLEYLVAEISRRNNLFKKSSCKDYRDFRKKNSAEKLPRVILIIDEFQRLFEADANRVMYLLEILTKQGRSSGLHLIFATQTFKGIGGNNFAGTSFSQIKGQFGGRLALRCSADDSKDILGQNNEAAAELEIGFAILNTGGTVRGNRKFAVPEAKAEDVKRTIQALAKNTPPAQIKIFDGKTLPPFPADEEFRSDTAKFLLGQHLNYDADNFFVELSDKPEQNLLFCGKIQTFFDCALKFAAVTNHFSERVYIGKNPPKNFIPYQTPQEFFDAVKDLPFDQRRLVILEACEFPKPSFSPKPPEMEFFKFWRELSEHGSHILAFYETFNLLKSSNLDVSLFTHRVAYNLPQSHISQLGGNIQFGAKDSVGDEFKAAYLHMEQLTWFQPFAEN